MISCQVVEVCTDLVCECFEVHVFSSFSIGKHLRISHKRSSCSNARVVADCLHLSITRCFSFNSDCASYTFIRGKSLARSTFSCELGDMLPLVVTISIVAFMRSHATFIPEPY